MRVIGAPCFARDEEVVLFVHHDDKTQELHVLSLAEGKFTVLRDRKGDRVQRDLSGIEFSQTTPVKFPESLKELETVVRDAAR
jgi:hypothetical protein